MRTDKFECENCKTINEISQKRVFIGYLFEDQFEKGSALSEVTFFRCTECCEVNFIPYLGYFGKEVEDETQDIS